MVQFDIYAASIDAFREDGKSDLMNGRNPVVQDDYNDCFEVRNGLLYHLDFVGDVTGPFSAVLLRNKDKNLILNGDEGSVRFSVHGKSKTYKKSITISFECLSRFYDTTPEQVAQWLVDGSLQLVDYTKDMYKTLENGSSPGFGYTRMGYLNGKTRWHRPASALFYDKDIKFSIVMGMDEGSYFGCVLQDNPKTVNDAFKSLIPTAAKGKKFRRHGEWFLVPVKAPPSVENRILESDEILSEVINLGRDDEDSSKHFVSAKKIVVGSDMVVYADSPTIRHENMDHADISVYGWTAFYRNTAIRSFSVRGVD